MADIKWSAFPSTAGAASSGDTLVGLHSGANYQFGITASPTALAIAQWDANSNLSANNFLAAYATTATAAATTTLTVASKYQQYFTGSTTQTVILPVTSTLVLGQSFYIVNNSSGVVTVQSSGANTIQAMAANSSLLVTCILTSGTTAASWNAEYSSKGGGSVSSGTANQLAYYAATGDIVSGLTIANQAILTTDGSGAPAWNSLLAGQILIGTTSGSPSAASINSGAGILVANSSGSITVSATGGGIGWTAAASTPVTAAINTGYIVTDASAVTFTLPATAAIGSVIRIAGQGAGGWVLAANTGQTIKMAASTTSSGGSLTSAEQYDTIEVVCVVANTTWVVLSAITTGFTIA